MPLSLRFQRNDVLAGRKNHLADSDHAFFADRLADNGKSLLADLAIRSD